MTSKRLKFWGWGLEQDVLSAGEVQMLESAYANTFGIAAFDATPVPRAEEIQLRAPRLTVPTALAQICTTDHYERLLHAYGKSFFDSARI
jgi:alkyldihydroxyacetonephosphate synthase